MSSSHDVALILLSQKYHLSEKIGPICLAQVRENYSSIKVFAAGYGRCVSPGGIVQISNKSNRKYVSSL
jgi:hypothetical protein